MSIGSEVRSSILPAGAAEGAWQIANDLKPRLRGRLRRAREAFEEPPYSPVGSHTSPIPGARETDWALAPQPPVVGIDLNEDAQVELMRELAPLWGEVPDAPRDGWRFRGSWMFAPLDAIVYYALLRKWKPSRLVEVGSGFSSALALDCGDRHLPELRKTFIEPYPDRLFGLLSERDKEQTEIHTKPVQEVPLEVFDRLEPGDVLFVDTDHFTKAGCEVNWMAFNVFPRLPAGVHVQIHDIYWPFEYPVSWLKERRGYNEVYFFRAFLMDNPNYRIRLMNNWVWREHPELFTSLSPEETCAVKALNRPGSPSIGGPGSLWIDKC
jgi:hypothetical protein